MPGDDPNGLVDSDDLLGPEVVHVSAWRVAVVLSGAQHGGHAILDVEIRLGLPAVSENGQMGGIPAQGMVEVVDVAMRVPLSEYRHEAANEARKPKPAQ